MAEVPKVRVFQRDDSWFVLSFDGEDAALPYARANNMAGFGFTGIQRPRGKFLHAEQLSFEVLLFNNNSTLVRKDPSDPKKEQRFVIEVVPRSARLHFLDAPQFNEERPISPPAGQADDDEFWFGYFRKCLTADSPGTPVSFTALPRKRHATNSSRWTITAHSYFGEDRVHQKWFIKGFDKEDDWHKEYAVNRGLTRWTARNPEFQEILLLASYCFCGRLIKGSPVVYFLVFPFFEGYTLAELTNLSALKHKPGIPVPAPEVMLIGLAEILMFYAETSSFAPRRDGYVNFWHRDLHAEQVMFGAGGRCKLLDFGNTHLEYEERQQDYRILGSRSSTPRTEEVYRLCDVFVDALKQQANARGDVLGQRITGFKNQFQAKEVTHECCPYIQALVQDLQIDLPSHLRTPPTV